MKLIITFIALFILSGCTSRVILSTADPASKEYDLSFGWLLVRKVDKGELSNSERELAYTKIINQALKNDPNTNSCTVIENSFAYYEPGCCATVRVVCKNQIELKHIGDSYNKSGTLIPYYQYRLIK